MCVCNVMKKIYCTRGFGYDGGGEETRAKHSRSVGYKTRSESPRIAVAAGTGQMRILADGHLDRSFTL